MYCAAVFFATFVVQLAAANHCKLDQYDVAPLEEQSYWEVQVDITNCHYYYQFGSCVVYFSVCGELPASICGSGNAVCQVAFSQDRKSNRSFVLGKASTESIQPLNGSMGFRQLTSGGNQSNLCNTSMTAEVVFTCDATAIWIGGAIDAGHHLKRFTMEGCQNKLEMKYYGACYNTPRSEDCELIPGPYNVTSLQSRDFWYAVVPNSNSCYRTSLSLNPCVVLFALCHPLPRGACGNATVCQATTGISLNVLKFGGYQPVILLMESANGFTIQNTRGTTTSRCPNGLSSSLVFVCDPAANWDTLQDGNVTRYLLSVVPNQANCMTTISFKYNQACVPVNAAVIAGSVVGVLIVPVSVIVVIVIVAVTYRYLHSKYGGYTHVGVHEDPAQMERLLFAQATDTEESDDSSPANASRTEEPRTTEPANTRTQDTDTRIPTLEAYEPETDT